MNRALDRVRQKVAAELGEVPSDAAALTWVTDFPMFEWCAFGSRVYPKNKPGSRRLPTTVSACPRPACAVSSCQLRMHPACRLVCLGFPCGCRLLDVPNAAGPAFWRFLLHIAGDANLAAQMQP